MNTTTPPPHRKTHRKRVSALRLSSDTTPTLPEYHPAPPVNNWRSDTSDLHSDKPPDYSDSAEEADADTSENDDSRTLYVPHQLSPASSHTSSPRSPRRSKRHTSHKRKQSSVTSNNDPYLDSLLARSVHALEMSNTLLQSSISTQTSLTTILGSGSDTTAERTLEARAHVLSSRIRQWDAEQPSWMGDLEEITRGVEGLFGSPATSSSAAARNRKISTGSISSSLPSSSSPLSRRHGKRPSLDLKQASEALTQYVVAGLDQDSDEDDILLPSTLGLRVSSSMHSIPHSPHLVHTHVHNSIPELASLSTPNLMLHAAPSLPILTDRPVEPSTPAYNMLSTFVVRNFTSSFMRPRRGRASSSGSTERGHIPQNQARRRISPERIKPGVRQSRSQTPRREFSPLMDRRTMTPPLEESSSSDSCVGKQTILSLRKILDEQPSPPKPSPSPTKTLKAPSFLPHILTVGVSRAFSRSNTPSSSGLSTPKRISFAELPESYASTRPEAHRANSGKGKSDKDSADESGWWSWFGVSGSMAKHEERMEDRMNRAWGGRMGAGISGSVDEWAI
ncbi:hypothetical protein BDQ17DRAFT_1359831 [Cyathus striatus]|nr:hypothetical protein BDQ17DRAFT_1359831 [Cyathus striatus]